MRRQNELLVLSDTSATLPCAFLRTSPVLLVVTLFHLVTTALAKFPE